jgi:nitrogen fixation protein NifB
MNLDVNNHPCFNEEVRRRTGRIHLPVAPACTIQCRYCNRRFDCIHESRPGVSSTVLQPEQARAWLHEMVSAHPAIGVVGIAGPGDPFANAERTMATLRLVRRDYPAMVLCVATNGLAIGPHIDELGALAVSHVTVTMNAVDPRIGKELYRWVRDGTRVLRGTAAAERLLERQLEAIPRLKRRGIIVKVNAIIVPGVNEDHIEEVARTAADYGADILNCLPLYPAPGSDFAHIPEPSAAVTRRVRAGAAAFIPLMHHCARCRADAVGLLGQSPDKADGESLLRHGRGHSPRTGRPYIAVATSEGCLVNEHLGAAAKFHVYDRGDDGPVCIERRPAPPPGGGDGRWMTLAERLGDCHALVVRYAGARPRQVLGEQGIQVHTASGLITPVLEALFGHKPLPVHLTTSLPARCGEGCGGGGEGCGG